LCVLRREVYHRPLLVAAFGLTLGLLMRELTWLALLALGLVLVAPTWSGRVLALATVGLGLLIGQTRVEGVSSVQRVSGVAQVITVPRVSGTREIASLRVGEFVYRASLPLEVRASLGDTLQISARGEPFPPWQRTQWERRGVHGRLTVEEATVVSEGPPWWRWGRQWRDSFRSFTSRHLSAESAGLADAVCFNVDGGLDDEIREDLRTVGVIHIVSASGLHVGIFALFLQSVLSRLPIDRRWQLVLLLGVLLLYMGATGLRPPVVRAVAMAGLLLTAYLWRREADLLSALGLAAVGNLLLDPRAVWDIGFQLSFVAVLGIGLFPWYPRPRREGESSLADPIAQSAWISLVATFATGPLIAYNFGYLSVVGVLANLIVSVPVTVIVVGSLAAWMVSWVPVLPALIMAVVEGAGTSMLVAVEFMASWPFAAVEFPPFAAGWMLPAWMVGLALWRFRERPA
jgi:competence protein ComEC